MTASKPAAPAADCSTICCASPTTALVLAQRLGEWVGKGPVLEEDIASTNVGLDLLGQARCGSRTPARSRRSTERRSGAARTSSRISATAASSATCCSSSSRTATTRDTIARQFLFDQWHVLLLGQLDALARCAHRGHRRQGGEGSALSRRALGRLGRPAGRRHRQTSHARMQAAIDALWMYTGEMFAVDATERALIDAGDRRRWRGAATAVAVVGATRCSTRRRSSFPPTRSCRARARAAASRVCTPSICRGCSPRCRCCRARMPGRAMVTRQRNAPRAVQRAATRGRRRALDAIWRALGGVVDPEIPIVSIVELGIVRGVARASDGMGRDALRRRIRDARRRASSKRTFARRSERRSARTCASSPRCRPHGRPTGSRPKARPQAARSRHRAAARGDTREPCRRTRSTFRRPREPRALPELRLVADDASSRASARRHARRSTGAPSASSRSTTSSRTD